MTRSRLLRSITGAEKDAFAEDGVICLRGHFDAGWVAWLQAATEEVLAQRWLTAEYSSAGDPGRFAYSEFMWRVHHAFYEFAHASPAAAIAGELMAANKINLFTDQLFVKEPGTTERTRWHHDLPFWPLAGTQVCSIWLALDPVTRATGGVEYVAGSHRWPIRFRPNLPFSAGMARKRNMDLPPCPAFDELRDQHRVVGWDLEPGDCLVFDVLTVHGSAGNASSSARRRGFATRWCGDDVTYVDDDFVLAPPVPPGLATGDPLDSDLFPVLWRRGE